MEIAGPSTQLSCDTMQLVLRNVKDRANRALLHLYDLVKLTFELASVIQKNGGRGTVKLHEQGRYAELVDPRLEARAADVAQVERLVRVALCCLHEDAATRPTMSAVAAMLDGSMDAPQPRTDLLRHLKMYGRGVVDLRPAPAGPGWMHMHGGGKPKGGSDTNAGVSSSWSPPSCVSAQQLSGPR